MGYEPVDIVERLKATGESAYAKHQDAAGAATLVAWRMAGATVADWRTALVAEVERQVGEVSFWVTKDYLRDVIKLIKGQP